jgi:hypothetical protein
MRMIELQDLTEMAVQEWPETFKHGESKTSLERCQCSSSGFVYAHYQLTRPKDIPIYELRKTSGK